VPPAGVMDTVPVDAPLHRTFVWVKVAVSAEGSVMVTDCIAGHPPPSVIVTVYVPAARPEISSVVALLDHRYVYGGIPPVTVSSMDPVDIPLQIRLVCVSVIFIAVGCEMVTVNVSIHKLASVTITVYAPEASPVISSVEAPFDHT
jgi:hypothetical protein